MEHAAEISIFVGAVIILPPLLPLLVLSYPMHYSWIRFSSGDIVILSLMFGVTVFVLPALFVQVALNGSYRAAFNPIDAVQFIVNNVSAYLRAWGLSILVSAVALASGPLAP
jgi:hypothetical protein